MPSSPLLDFIASISPCLHKTRVCSVVQQRSTKAKLTTQCLYYCYILRSVVSPANPSSALLSWTIERLLILLIAITRVCVL